MNTLSTQQQNAEKTHKVTSMVITIVFHALLIGLLLTLFLRPPNPPLGQEETMMAISLGEPDQGGPDNTPAAEQPEVVASNPENSNEENILTSDAEEAPVVKTNPEKKNTTEKIQTNTKTEEAQPKVNDKALFKGNRTNGDPNSQGMGDGDVPGNQGDPDGSENGDPHGIVGGEGHLKGRVIKYKPNYDSKSKTTGTVYVTIYVDRNGNVTKAEPGARGTTTTDPELWQIARRVAMDTKYSPKPDAPALQVGTIPVTFNYKP
jgi:outer membrane biosynthesis protein TonB